MSVKWIFNCSVVGAGTVNTEFEIMTGMNLDDFGSGELPFKTVLTNHTSESICYNLKNTVTNVTQFIIIQQHFMEEIRYFLTLVMIHFHL